VLAKRDKSRGRQGGRAPLGVVHRLDKETSGVMVFTRTLEAKKHLSQQFREHTVERRYLALVHGRMERPVVLESYLLEDRGDGLRGSARGTTKGGQRAVTHVKPKRQLQGATLVECRLETGRTHQIRIHLSEAGHPLVGERVYIRNYAGPRLEAPRMMLHAAALGFIHPVDEEPMAFDAPLPADFERVLAALGG
jgi:23S rRNA pseudouridine1911/1915/1917 synthase